MSTSRKVFIAASALAVGLATFGLGSSASASTLKFYTGGSGYTGPFNGTGTVYAATSGTSLETCAQGCTTASDNDSNTSLTFPSLATPLLTATATDNNVQTNVWGDFVPNFGGLGVGVSGQDDQIEGAQVLTLSFNTQVTLTGIGTLFASGHTPFGDVGWQLPGDISGSNQILVNDGDGSGFQLISLSDANTVGNISLTGTTFMFEQFNSTIDPNGCTSVSSTYNSGECGPQFYVSALTYDTGSKTTVPLPAALPLFATGLGALGLLGWRKKRKVAGRAAV
jgi:hypothetical protein